MTASFCPVDLVASKRRFAASDVVFEYTLMAKLKFEGKLLLSRCALDNSVLKYLFTLSASKQWISRGL